MITSIADRPAILAITREVIDACPAPLSKADRAYAVYESRLNDIARRMVAIARPWDVVSKTAMRRALICNSLLGDSYSEREYVFDRAWDRAANTHRRRWVDDIDHPGVRAHQRVHDEKPRPLRRSSRPRRSFRAA